MVANVMHLRTSDAQTVQDFFTLFKAPHRSYSLLKCGDDCPSGNQDGPNCDFTGS